MWLIEKLDLILAQSWPEPTLVRECRDALAKQAERVTALERVEELSATWQSDLNNLRQGGYDVEAYQKIADELAAALREGQ